MRIATIVLCCIAGLGPALAEGCPGNANALGTSRTVVVDGATLPLIGTLHYPTTVPLNDHEVVLTFDDGPHPGTTEKVLATLKSECVKATFFMVGYVAKAFPKMVRQVYNEGHSIGVHSMNHPIGFAHLGMSGLEQEVGVAFATIRASLGDPRAVSTFFRSPGLAKNASLEGYLKPRAISLWSADAHGSDWMRINSDEVVRRAMAMIEAKKGGVLLLHDTHPKTVLALPVILRQLKERGYKVVHAVGPGEQPTTVPVPNGAPPLVADLGWPRTLPEPATATERFPTGESDKAADERVVPTLADGDGAMSLMGPGNINAGMKPGPPDRKQSGAATETVPEAAPARYNWRARRHVHMWHYRTAPHRKHSATPAAWTVIGRN